MSPILQGCQLMPAGASDPLTPARQGQVIDIQCQTDTEYDTCIFTHTKPFDVGQSSYNEDRVSGMMRMMKILYVCLRVSSAARVRTPGQALSVMMTLGSPW